jgi:hypothetical protein
MRYGASYDFSVFTELPAPPHQVGGQVSLLRPGCSGLHPLQSETWATHSKLEQFYLRPGLAPGNLVLTGTRQIINRSRGMFVFGQHQPDHRQQLIVRHRLLQKRLRPGL